MNQEEKRERNRRYQSKWRAANPEKERDKVNQYRAAHLEERRKYTREHNNRYYKEHPEKKHKGYLLRRAAKAKTICDLTQEQEKEILARGCFFCGSHNNLTIAHDIAVSKGGNTTRGNVFCACSKCNSRQRTKPLIKLLRQTNLPL